VNLHAVPARDETPAIAAADDLARILADARIGDAGQLLDSIVARKTEIMMSDADLERIAGLSAGHVTKILAARTRSPTIETLDKLLAALQLSIVLIRDGSRAADVQWAPRDASKVRTKVRERPLSRAALARARATIMGALLRRASQPKWRDTPARDFMRSASARRSGRRT
jgi:transcriptional regulator with XRE-family HTH domain